MDVMSLRRMLLMQLVNGGEDMEFVKSYTVEESWENDTKGNPVNIGRTILDGVSNKKLKEIFILMMRGNAASNYKCDAVVVSCNDSMSVAQGYIIRANWTQGRDYATSPSSWVSQGPVIDVYKTSFPS